MNGRAATLHGRRITLPDNIAAMRPWRVITRSGTNVPSRW